MAYSSARSLMVAIALLAAAPTAALAASTSLQAASYSPRWKVVVIPYHGALPTYTMHTLANPPRVYLDLEARAFMASKTEEIKGHPALVRFAMAPRGQEEARVTLTFKTPTRVRVVHNARKKLLLLVPESGAAPAPKQAEAPRPAPSPTPTPAAAARLGAPRYDAGSEAVLVPLTGPMPAFKQATLPDPPRVYVDFQAPGPQGVRRGGNECVRWVMAPRGAGSTRLTLTFERQTPVQVRHDAEGGAIVLAPTFPEAAPGAPAPQPSVSPTPAPTASPVLEIQPATPESPVREEPTATP
ncbi:MAG: hypothetical protein ACLGIN_00240 [Candidatus Sericytochromatia bacterium]